MSPSALVLAGVRFVREDLSLRFDLTVREGEWLALIGPSGAGKSTLLDLVAGFAEPASGDILVAGRPVRGLAPSERPLSIVFQDNNLFPNVDVFRNVALGIAPDLRISRDQRKRIEAALDEVGLAGFGSRMPDAMSGGERQRVALARAFLRERPLLLLDEPFAALGPALRREMLEILGRLRERAGRERVAIVMVTHHPEDAVGRADRAAFLDRGEIVAAGPTQEILSGRSDPRIGAYLGLPMTDR